MKSAAIRIGVPLILLAAIAGCSKQDSLTQNLSGPAGGTGATTAVHEAEISAAMASSPELIEDSIAESADPTTFEDGAAAGAKLSLEAAIRPVTFWRRIGKVERRFEFAFADTDSTGQPTRALVTIHKRLSGTFNVLAGDPAGPVVASASDPRPPLPPDTSLTLYRKPLVDHWTRRVLLLRVPPPPSDSDDVATDAASWRSRPRWRIAATSGVKVTSEPNDTRIVSLHVKTATQDTVIDDPLALRRLRRLIRFESGENVELTVTTRSATDAVALNYRALRLRFVNNGDHTYTARFRAAWFEGVHHLGVNALSHGTLFDDTAPYDSDAWILPYVVAPTAIAGYRP